MQNKRNSKFKFKLSFYSCLVCSAVTFGATGVGYADVQHPNSSWNVIPIAGGAGQSQTCIVSAIFQNNDQLIFARDMTGALSGALVAKNIENTGRVSGNIKVNIDIDGRYKRHFLAEWGYDQKFVFPIGHDYDFFDGLKAGSQLKIELPEYESSTRYSLKGSSDGLNGMNDCLREFNGGQRLAFEAYDPYEIEPAAFEQAILTPSGFGRGGVANYVRVYHPPKIKRIPDVQVSPVEKTAPIPKGKAITDTAEIEEVIDIETSDIIDAPVPEVVETVQKTPEILSEKVSDVDDLNIAAFKAEPIKRKAAVKVTTIKHDEYKPPERTASLSKMAPQKRTASVANVPSKKQICKLDDTVPKTRVLLRRAIKENMQPQLSLLGQGYYKIPLDYKTGLDQVTWNQEDVRGYFSVIPYKGEDTTAYNIQSVILSDLKNGCEGDFAQTTTKHDISTGVTRDDHTVVCVSADLTVMANISFISDGFETAVLSLESSQANFRKVEKQRDLILENFQ